MKKSLKSLIASRNSQEIIAKFGQEFWNYLQEEIGGKYFRLWEDFVQMFVENICFRGHLLDFGCGFGVESMLLAPHFRQITAIDINERKISVFKKLLSQTGIKNVRPLLADGQNLPFAKNGFDFVFCNESLSHVSHINKALKEIKRVLRPDGQIVVADTKRWNPYGLWMRYIKRDFEENYFNIWTMKKLLSEAGYKNIRRVKYITAPRDPFRRWSRQLWFILRFIDPKYVLIASKE